MDNLGEMKFSGLTISAGEGLTIRTPRRIEWLPSADITAHELALAMPALLAAVSTNSGMVYYVEDMIGSLPEAARRHFKVSDWR